MIELNTIKPGDRYIRFIDAVVREYHEGDKLHASTCYLYTGTKDVGEEDSRFIIDQLYILAQAND